jgi:hypothetical protein
MVSYQERDQSQKRASEIYVKIFVFNLRSFFGYKHLLKEKEANKANRRKYANWNRHRRKSKQHSAYDGVKCFTFEPNYSEIETTCPQKRKQSFPKDKI